MDRLNIFFSETAVYFPFSISQFNPVDIPIFFCDFYHITGSVWQCIVIKNRFDSAGEAYAANAPADSVANLKEQTKALAPFGKAGR